MSLALNNWALIYKTVFSCFTSYVLSKGQIFAGPCTRKKNILLLMRSHLSRLSDAILTLEMTFIWYLSRDIQRRTIIVFSTCEFVPTANTLSSCTCYSAFSMTRLTHRSTLCRNNFVLTSPQCHNNVETALLRCRYFTEIYKGYLPFWCEYRKYFHRV